jgi:hypothetical protein
MVSERDGWSSVRFSRMPDQSESDVVEEVTYSDRERDGRKRQR